MYLVQCASNEFSTEPFGILTAVGVAPVHRSISIVRGGEVRSDHRDWWRSSSSSHGSDSCRSSGFNHSSRNRSVLVLFEVDVEVITTQRSVVLLCVGAIVRAGTHGNHTAVLTDWSSGGGQLSGVRHDAVALQLALTFERAWNEIITSVGGLLAGYKDLVTPAT